MFKTEFNYRKIDDLTDWLEQNISPALPYGCYSLVEEAGCPRRYVLCQGQHWMVYNKWDDGYNQGYATWCVEIDEEIASAKLTEFFLRFG
jgi:hypothetical protein